MSHDPTFTELDDLDLLLQGINPTADPKPGDEGGAPTDSTDPDPKPGDEPDGGQNGGPAKPDADPNGTEGGEGTEDETIVGRLATLLGVDPGDDITDDEDGLVNLTKKAAQTMYEQQLEQENAAFPVLAEFRKYLADGGDPAKYLQTINSNADLASLDKVGDDVNLQKRVIAETYRYMGFTDDEIKTELADLEAAGLLAKKAETSLVRLKAERELDRRQLVETQEQLQQKALKEYQEFQASVRTKISTTNAFKGLTLAETEKKAFEDYLFKTVKDGKSQRDLDVETADLDTQLAVDLLLFKGFDIKKLAKNILTQQAKDTLTERLRRRGAPAGGSSAAAGRPGGIEDLNLP